MSRVIDLTGQRFGKLVVKEFAGFTHARNAQWLCDCECGNTKIISSSSLRKPRRPNGGGCARSCGCLRKIAPSEANRRHGMFGTRIYGIWSGMRGRCERLSHTAAKNYQDRGIFVCDEWKKFDAFYAWAINSGYDVTLTIDRIDNDAGYCPENCRFISLFEQQSNKRTNVIIEYNGESMTVSQWARKLQIKRVTLESRIRSGWTIERAFFEKVGAYRGK